VAISPRHGGTKQLSTTPYYVRHFVRFSGSKISRHFSRHDGYGDKPIISFVLNNSVIVTPFGDSRLLAVMVATGGG
jgi:hypothetical protein